jgi:hypothetical protein
MEKLKLDKHAKKGRRMTKHQIVLDIIATLGKGEAASFAAVAAEAKKSYGADITNTYVNDIARGAQLQTWIGSRAVVYNPKAE